MLDKRFIREHPDVVRQAVRQKKSDVDVDELLALDESMRKLQQESEGIQATKKSLSRGFAKADEQGRAELRAQSVELDRQYNALREELSATDAKLTELMLLVPNIPWSGAPIGTDESANVVIKTWGSQPRFDFDPVDHVELAEYRGWAEFARARNVAGERAYALKGDLLMLERAIHSFALDQLIAKDFTPISVPVIVREAALVGSGMFPKGREETYELASDNAFLAGTSEVALVGLHSGEILDGKSLPLRYAGVSTCFRREIGSAGRDVRGLLRVHQFEKVEQFVICEADEAQSGRWHAALLESAEQILQALGMYYQIVECSTGDMGLGKFRMNDINTWFPSLDTFRETHSCSTLHEWQARRANLRYRDAEGKIRFAHTLNNTAAATPRLLAAVIENYQTRGREVVVPAVLRPYLGGRDIL